VRGGDGFHIARDILDSGRALARMRAIIEAQGGWGFDHQHPPLGALSFDIRAEVDGTVIGIDNLQMAQIARLAGAPKVKAAGVDLLRKLGESVRQGEPLYRVYAAYPSDLEFARQACVRSSGYRIGAPEQAPQVFVEF
jgi:thymidine phosphorylase